MAEIVSLADAVPGLVGDGDLVALEGFTHLIPFAAGHEIIRQQRRRHLPSWPPAGPWSPSRRWSTSSCPRPGAVVLPGGVVDAVAVAPGGAHPSYAADGLPGAGGAPEIASSVVEDVRAATGWDLQVAASIAATPAPTRVELAALRALRAAMPK